MTDGFLKLVSENDKRTKEVVADVLAVLEEVSDALTEREDVVDGDYGNPAPNWAMRLNQDVERAIKRIKELGHG